MDDVDEALLKDYIYLNHIIPYLGFSEELATTRAKQNRLPFPAMQFYKNGPFMVRKSDVDELIKKAASDAEPEKLKEKARQKKEERKNKETCLYRHFDSAGNLLYVGISLSVISRQSAHRRIAPWEKEIATITIERHKTHDQAWDAETAAIRIEKPKYNIAKVEK